MKTRAIKPILRSVASASPSTYYFDAQFGEAHYVSKDISASITSRIDACGDVYIVMVEE